MDRSRALELLAALKPTLVERYGVTRLALFGSTARGMAREGSDIDLLIAFDGPATAERYFGALFALEDALGCTIDLVTEKGLRAELRPFVEAEIVGV